MKLRSARSLALVSSLCLAASLPAFAQDAESSEISMTGPDDGGLGTVTATPAPGGVLFELDLSGLPEGQWVAFHVHETGACEADGGFESAGGHFAPEGHAHGYLSEDGPHAGDMPNQYTAPDGSLRAQVFNPNVSMAADAGNGIQGRALVLHGGSDDYESQPSGDAGDGIACGVIE